MSWAILFIILLIFVLWGYVTSGLIIKVERLPLDFNPRSFGYDFEEFKTFTEDQVEISGWIVPSKSRSDSAILVLHGWGTNRSDMLPSTLFLADQFNLVYFDFRNHGRSGGNKTSLTCMEIKDFTSVVRFLEREKKVLAGQIGVFGFSMGGAVAISGAAQLPQIKAVAAESPFSSYEQAVVRFAKLFYKIPAFPIPITLFFAKLRLGFDPEPCSPLYHAAQISPRPLLIMQGGGDLRMPVSEGRSLYDAAKEPKEIWVAPSADHGKILESDPDEYKRRLLKFFEKSLKKS